MLMSVKRCRAIAVTAISMMAVPLALASPASALSPGELFVVSGVPGANAFLPGLANDSALAEAGTTTSLRESDNTRKLSDDGRYVVFASKADGLSNIDDNRFGNIFVQDRLTGAVTLVNVPAPGGSSEGESSEPVISGDGREVAFTSTARLSPQDTDEQPDVYLRNLETGTTKLISVRADGAQGIGANDEPDLSRDGSTVAFASTVADTFSSTDADPDADIYTAKVATGELTLISRASGNGVDAAGDARSPAISGDGSAVAFETVANNIDEPSNPDTDEQSDIYLRSGGLTTLISRAGGKEGAKGNEESFDPAISDNGNLVAFSSFATNLVKDKVISFAPSVYVHDVITEETVLVSRQSTSEGSAPTNGASFSPTVSSTADGTQIAFVSEATNLAGGLSDETARAYVRTIGAGTTALVSRASGPSGEPVETEGASSIATVSASAQPPVAFTSAAALSDEVDPNFSNVYVREGATTSWRSRPPAGSPWQAGAGVAGLGESPGRVISRDGRFVVFVSSANAYRPPGAPAGELAYVRDLVTGSITLASRADGPNGAAVVGSDPTISGDGTKVAFESVEAVVPGVPAGIEQLYVRDLASGRTLLASELEGTPGNGASHEAAISADGRWVAFESSASNLGGPHFQVYAHDLETGQTVLVSRAGGSEGEAANESSFAPSIDADGTHVTFASGATNLDPTDKDRFISIYERDLAKATTTIVSVGPGGVPNNEDAFASVVSGDGSRVAFASFATNLDPVDTSPEADVFVRDITTGRTLLASQPHLPTFPVESFDLSEDGSTVTWVTFGSVLPEDKDKSASLYARDLASATTSLIGRDGSNAPLQTNVDRGAVNANASCVAIALGGSGEFEEGPLLSPGIPGTTPSPDFPTVILRALKPDCLPTPPAPVGAPGPAAAPGTAIAADHTPPLLTHVSLTNTRFRRSARATATLASAHAATRTRVGTTLRFTLSEAASVTVSVERATPGRRVGRTCRRPAPSLHRRASCTRHVLAGSLTRAALTAGTQQIAFSGRLGTRPLALGGYRLTVVATDPSGNRSAPHRLSFVIVAR
jgi:Tol biopolymer transport system component